jgi:hypothetical protein
MKDCVEFKAEYDSACVILLSIGPVTLIIVFVVVLFLNGWAILPLGIFAATFLFEILLYWTILPHHYTISDESLYIQLGYPISWTVPMNTILSAKDVSDEVFVVRLMLLCILF